MVMGFDGLLNIQLVAEISGKTNINVRLVNEAAAAAVTGERFVCSRERCDHV